MVSPGSSDAHRCGADLADLHAALGHYARLYWDLQQMRVAVNNRAQAMDRDGLSAGLGALHALDMGSAVDGLSAIEHQVQRTLRRLARQHFMRDWIEAQRGLDVLGFASLMGVTGPLERFATVSKLWKYLGLHVVDGHAARRVKGQPWTHTACTFGHLRTCPPGCTTDHHPACVSGGIGTAYAPKGRVICHQIGEAIVKVGKGGPWRAHYDRKKAQYEAERADWTQARRHNAAMRYAVKMLLKEMFLEWHRRQKAQAA